MRNQKNKREANSKDLFKLLDLHKELNPKDIPLEKDKAKSIYTKILSSDSFKIF